MRASLTPLRPSGQPRGQMNTNVLLPHWKRGRETVARGSSDAVFLRRVYLDVMGTLPTPPEVQNFLKDMNPEKRALLIDALLEREEFAQYCGRKSGAISCGSRPNSQSISGRNAVQAYHHWI